MDKKLKSLTRDNHCEKSRRDVKHLVTLYLKSRTEKNEQLHAQSFAFLFACAQSDFSIFAHFRSTCLGNSDALSALGFLISTNLIKITDLPMVQHSIENSSLKFAQVTLGSVKMTIKLTIILRIAKTETEIYCLALENQSFGGIAINLNKTIQGTVCN